MDNKELSTSVFAFIQALHQDKDDWVGGIIDMVNELPSDQREIWLRSLAGGMKYFIKKNIEINPEIINDSILKLYGRIGVNRNYTLVINFFDSS